MNVQKFVYEALCKIRAEVVEKESWKNTLKPASEMTEMEISNMQSEYLDAIHKVGQVTEFLNTWLLFTNEED